MAVLVWQMNMDQWMKWEVTYFCVSRYVISSVQFEIGVMENETDDSDESGTTPAPVETDK